MSAMAAGLEQTSIVKRNCPAKHLSLSDVEFVLWDVAAHLDVPALCALCAAGKHLLPRGSAAAEDELWRLVANHTYMGFVFAGIDKQTILKLLSKVKDIPVVDSEALQVNGPQLARSMVQAASQAQTKSMAHMRDGGLFSLTFVSRFRFPPRTPQAWLSDPTQTVRSFAIPFPVGSCILSISLAMNNDELSLHVERTTKEGDGKEEEEAQDEVDASAPLLLSIRGLSSSLILRQDFALTAEGRCDHLGGLYSAGPPRAAADALGQGLACVVSLRDCVGGAPWVPVARTVNLLNLDRVRR